MDHRTQAIDFSKWPEVKKTLVDKLGLRSFARRVRRRLRKDKGWPLQTRKARKERAQYGIGRTDIWGLDTYLVMVLERGLRMLGEEVHGWPPITTDGRDWTYESWKAHLIEQADKLKRALTYPNEVYGREDYQVGDGIAAEEEADRLIEEVLADIVPIFRHLWD